MWQVSEGGVKTCGKCDIGRCEDVWQVSEDGVKTCGKCQKGGGGEDVW